MTLGRAPLPTEYARRRVLTKDFLVVSYGVAARWANTPPSARTSSMIPPELHDAKIPFVGVGCIVTRADGTLLLVRNHGGGWSPPGGHLDFGESLEDCAARETFEETGVRVRNVEFVAVTNDLMEARGKHYVTIWMRGDADGNAAVISDPAEIAELGWFRAEALPKPCAVYFENFLAGRRLPPAPTNLPFR